MADRFEENMGRYTYVTLEQVKDYLSISSSTQDARMSNIISYATGVIEHYIGQEILANNYTEVFDGGKSSVYTSRLPLNNVYQVSEYDGTEYQIIADASTTGMQIEDTTDEVVITTINNAKTTSKIKKFGKSSLILDNDDYLLASTIPDHLQLEESDFTIEAFVRVDQNTIQDNVILAINTDASNYMQFRLSNQYGLAFEANIAGSATIVQGSNTEIEAQQFAKRKWAHVAVTRVLDDEKVYLHYNGNTIAAANFAVDNLTFTSNVEIGTTFKGYMDEVKIANKGLYTSDFTTPTHRNRPDNDTGMLLHFDEGNGSTDIKDTHNTTSDYIYSRDTGRITKYSGSSNSSKTYPNITISGAPTFAPYASAVEVKYNAGYESSQVPYDLQMATLDFIKIIYKQDQEKKGFNFEGESGDKFPLSSNFPPHVKRILDLYRIIT